MSYLEYLIWAMVCGTVFVIFAYIVVRASTIAHYRSRSEYDRRAWGRDVCGEQFHKTGEKNDG